MTIKLYGKIGYASGFMSLAVLFLLMSRYLNVGDSASAIHQEIGLLDQCNTVLSSIYLANKTFYDFVAYPATALILTTIGLCVYFKIAPMFFIPTSAAAVAPYLVFLDGGLLSVREISVASMCGNPGSSYWAIGSFFVIAICVIIIVGNFEALLKMLYRDHFLQPR